MLISQVEELEDDDSKIVDCNSSRMSVPPAALIHFLAWLDIRALAVSGESDAEPGAFFTF